MKQPQPTSLFVTEGVSHSIDLLVSALTEPGDVVWTERPTYYLAAGIFRSHGLRVEALPMKNNSNGNGCAAPPGIDMNRLEAQLETGQRRAPRVIYIIPAYQNPVGHSMAARDRRRLARLAARYEILVIADEVYHLLDWRRHAAGDNGDAAAGRRPARMVQWNPSQQPAPESIVSAAAAAATQQPRSLSGCVSVSSLTKIFGPGVRCGWIETVSDDIIHAIGSKVGYIRSQGGVSPLVGAIVAQGLRDGTIEGVLERLRNTYEERCNLLCDILEQEQQGTGLQLVCRPLGGYFVWVRLPKPLGPVDDFLQFCREQRGVNFMPGRRCDASQEGDVITCNRDASLELYARFCFAYLDAETLRNGAHAFLECYREYIIIKSR